MFGSTGHGLCGTGVYVRQVCMQDMIVSIYRTGLVILHRDPYTVYLKNIICSGIDESKRLII